MPWGQGGGGGHSCSLTLWSDQSAVNPELKSYIYIEQSALI